MWTIDPPGEMHQDKKENEKQETVKKWTLELLYDTVYTGIKKKTKEETHSIHTGKTCGSWRTRTYEISTPGEEKEETVDAPKLASSQQGTHQLT